MSDDKHLERYLLIQAFMLHTTTELAALALIRHGEAGLAEDLRPIAEWFNAGFKAMQERDNES